MADLLIENKLVTPSLVKSELNSADKRKTSINGRFINQLVSQQTSYNNKINSTKPKQTADHVPSSEQTTLFKLYAEENPDSEIKVNKKYDFEITHVETLHEFYIRRVPPKDAPDFRPLYNDMQYFYEKKSNLPQPLCKEGNACVYYDNIEKCWHRARISRVVGADHCLIKLVDRGETRYVNKATLRVIHDKYVEFPCQALRATLSDLEAKRDEEIDESVNVRFREIVLNKTVIGKVAEIRMITSDSTNSELNAFSVESRLHLVNLFDVESGESVYSLLVQDMNTTLNSSNVNNKFKPGVRSELEETQMQQSFLENSGTSILTNGNSVNVVKPILAPVQASLPQHTQNQQFNQHQKFSKFNR
jgi:hypothetical protein